MNPVRQPEADHGAGWVVLLTATTRAFAVGSAWLRSRAANRIAGSRRLMVPTFVPARASSVR
jgi:hypothetical protein